MKSIKSKLVMFFGAILICICLINMFISAYNNDKMLKDSEKIKLTEASEKSAEIVDNKCKDKIETLKSIARRSEFKSYDLKSDEIKKMINKEAEDSGFSGIFVIDLKGNMPLTSGGVQNIATDPIFQEALKGNSKISNPMTSGSKTLINICVPIYDDSNNIIGVLLGTQDFIEFSKSIIDSKYTSFIISSDGNLIAHSNEEMLDDSTRQENAKNEDIKDKMKNGENGFGEWILETDNVPQFIGYAHIESTNWSIGILEEKSIVSNDIIKQIASNVITYVIFLVIGLLLVYIYAKKISNGIKGLSEHLNIISKGNFSIPMDHNLTKLKDEVGNSAKAIEEMRKSLGNMIHTIKESAINMEQGSKELSRVSTEVQGNSAGISQAANEMAAGVQDQTTDLMQILEVVSVFSHKIDDIVMKITEINSRTNTVNDEVKKGNENAVNLGESVNGVNETFKKFTDKISNLTSNISQITDITMLINSIAEQTNLLALNASIEAARAGEAGKGFSVVADEIRVLAEQCKNSAENIDKLIKNVSDEASTISSSTAELDNELKSQITIIDSTVDSYKDITENIYEISEHLENITKAMKEINNEKNDILSKVESSTAVGEQISASTQEIAASTDSMKSSADNVEDASKKLLNLSDSVNEEINKFQI